MIRHLLWHGKKLHLNQYCFDTIAAETDLDRLRAELTLADLYTLGVIDMRNGGNVVVLLADGLEKWGGVE